MSDIFDNKWHSSDPTGSKSLVARFVITFFAVGARLLCKFLRGRRTLSLDDCFIVLALVTSTIGEALVFWGELALVPICVIEVLGCYTNFFVAVSKGGTGSFIPLLLEQGNYQGLQDFLLVRMKISGFFLAISLLSHSENSTQLIIYITSGDFYRRTH